MKENKLLGQLLVVVENGQYVNYDRFRNTKNYIKPITLSECSDLPFCYFYCGDSGIVCNYLEFRNLEWNKLSPNVQFILNTVQQMMDYNEHYICFRNIECDKNNYQLSIVLDFIIYVLQRYNVNISIETYSEFLVNRIGLYIIQKIISRDNIKLNLISDGEVVITKYDDEGDIINYPLGFFNGIDDLLF